jgi:two-component system sensor histidine kinase KdpD
MRARGYAAAVATVVACTLVCRAMVGRFDHANLIMVDLAGVSVVAVRGGRGPSALAACLSVAAFDFFFVPPHLTFAVADTQFLVTFSVMLAVGLLISTLAVRVREQAEAAERIRAEAEAERLRHTLLSSVSHDLRTPLAAITGAASALLREGGLDAETRRDLLEAISEESHRLDRLVTNLLDMTRMEAGPLQLHRDWLPVEEVVGSALARMEPRLPAARVDTSLPDDLPLVPVDAVLVEQLLVNLLENAVKYAGPGSRVHVRARAEGAAVLVEVEDDGPGFPPRSGGAHLPEVPSRPLAGARLRPRPGHLPRDRDRARRADLGRERRPARRGAALHPPRRRAASRRHPRRRDRSRWQLNRRARRPFVR